MEYETYQATLKENGTYFTTDCGNKMYSVKDDIMAYHGCLYPKCLSNGKQVTLYIRDSRDARNIDIKNK